MTKIKIAIVCAVALAALATDLFQFQTIKALRQENQALKQQQAAQITSLQAQLAQDTATASSDASIREAQVREVARLRGEVARLREATDGLAKARQEIQTLNQRVASETEARAQSGAALQAAQAETQRTQNMNVCLDNLRRIDGAKQQWALENKKLSTDTPAMEDLRPYLAKGPNGELPACPDGGTYTVGTVGERPTCSIPGHALP
jgi:hypothetical protein